MTVTIGRRELLVAVGGAAAWPLAARARPPAMPVIGVLYGVSAAEWAGHMVAFRRGLGETGFVEGRNVVIEYRWADGQYDRMPWMAADLISRRVAVILMGGNTDSVRAMLAATQTIPIVFTTGTDPLRRGSSPVSTGRAASNRSDRGRWRTRTQETGAVAMSSSPASKKFPCSSIRTTASSRRLISAARRRRRPRAGGDRRQRGHGKRDPEGVRDCGSTGRSMSAEI